MDIVSNAMKEGAMRKTQNCKMERHTGCNQPGCGCSCHIKEMTTKITLEIRSCDGDQYVVMDVGPIAKAALELFCEASGIHGGGCTPQVAIVKRTLDEWEDVTIADDLQRLRNIKAEKERIAKLAEARRTKAGLKDLEELGLL